MFGHYKSQLVNYDLQTEAGSFSIIWEILPASIIVSNIGKFYLSIKPKSVIRKSFLPFSNDRFGLNCYKLPLWFQ